MIDYEDIFVWLYRWMLRHLLFDSFALLLLLFSSLFQAALLVGEFSTRIGANEDLERERKRKGQTVEIERNTTLINV